MTAAPLTITEIATNNNNKSVARDKIAPVNRLLYIGTRLNIRGYTIWNFDFIESWTTIELMYNHDKKNQKVSAAMKNRRKF